MKTPAVSYPIEVVKARFFSRLDTTDPDECWLWQGARLGKKRYGLLVIGLDENGRVIKEYTHRLSYKWFVGEIPAGKLVCHTCDVCYCCNPAHLFLGTHKDNSRDMIEKGRWHGTEMTDDQVLDIVERTKRGEYDVDIAEEYGVTRETIHNILAGRTYTAEGSFVPRQFVRPNPPPRKRRLTPEQITFVRREFKRGRYSINDMARMFCVHYSTISRVARGQLYK